MIKKLILKGTGNANGRSFYLFEKENSFFSLFPIFLLNLGFKNMGDYDSSDSLDISKYVNKIQHFKNEFYDIDVVFTNNKIILIIRSEEDRSKLINAIERIT